MNKSNENKKLAGWEREFWNLLSPETTKLLKAELAKKDAENVDVSSRRGSP